MNFRILILKILNLFRFRILRPRLFHSIIVKGKNIKKKKICLAFKRTFLGVLKEYIRELI